MTELPQHLRKYIVEQNYERYTSIDHACWRFILRQLKSYLGVHAHPCYEEGLEKTGVEVERIPKISDISAKLEKMGWRALPVSGFIPPAAFMELQSLSVLPIASDMRSLDHLQYTPAPDIVHEAAGHAPMLANPEFAAYLKQYAQVAKKAIISNEDLELYEAIRVLSDCKENPASTPADVAAAQANLDKVSRQMSHVSEASELSRMNWWTAEYGLIGDLQNPKIYGAGLLSSVGESQLCLQEKVKKIPLSVNCIKTTYDITEPQPQLFVAKDFADLSRVLEDLAEQMAFRLGGLEGLNKALQAKSVNTVVYNSGLQVSGVLAQIRCDSKNSPLYLHWSGPCQLAAGDQELPGHGKTYHAQGFGSPIGHWDVAPDRCPSEFSREDLHQLGVIEGQQVTLRYREGVIVQGLLTKCTYVDHKLQILTFTNCEVRLGNEVLFAKDWGTYDMAIGSSIPSVFGGPADRNSYGELEDFQALRVPARKLSASEQKRCAHFQAVRDWREKHITGSQLQLDIETMLNEHRNEFPEDWLLYLELLELSIHRTTSVGLEQQLRVLLEQLAKTLPEHARSISDGVRLSQQMTI